MRVSHETIYRSLFIQARGALKKELMEHVRSKRRMRRSRHASEHAPKNATIATKQEGGNDGDQYQDGR
jgi:IS30 family transposase